MAAFEVTLRHTARPDEAPVKLHFELAPGDEIVFGRAADVDVCIPDPERKVSSRHGRIRCGQQGGLLAHDLGSLNGTFLSGEKLEVEDGKELVSGDSIRVGDYELLVSVLEDEFEATIRTSDVRTTADRLHAALADRYAMALDVAADARRDQLRAELAEAVGGMSRREGVALLDQLLAADEPPGVDARPSLAPGSMVPPPAPSAGPAASPMPEPPAAPASRPAAVPTAVPAAADVATEVLRRIADRFVPDSPLESDDDLRRFGDLLGQVCASTLAWLAKGLEGRGVFAQEFGAEVTLVFQRSNNPLKAMSHDELVRYLLDWRGDAAPETRDHYLQSVLKDLTEHQVGVLAGVKEAVMNVVQRLSPERIEAKARSQKGWSRSAKTWSAYRDLHSELAEEQAKLFDELISPAIQKGYLQRHDDEA